MKLTEEDIDVTKTTITGVTSIEFTNGCRIIVDGDDNLTVQTKEFYSKLLTVLPYDHPNSLSANSKAGKERLAAWKKKWN